MNNRELLARTAAVQLSISDWMLLMGWVSAYLTDETPAQILQSVREISSQVARGE